MKRFIVFLLVALLLSGCGAMPPAAQPIPTEPPAPSLPQVAPNEDVECAGIPDLPQASVNTVTYQYHTEDLKEYARIVAHDADHNEVWVYETPRFDMAQLQRVSPIGSWNDRFYFVEDGAVVALSAATGEVLWKNTDFGGSPAGVEAVAIDDNGTAYLCGFFGPDLFVVTADGTTVKKEDTLNGDYYWGHKLVLQEDCVVVYFSGGPEGDMGPEAYSVTVPLT